MKPWSTLAAALLLGCGLLCSTSWSQNPAEDLLRIATYEFGQSREPLTAVEDAVRAALGSPEEAARLAAGFAALLATDATRDAKQFVCRQLSLIGTGENVPALEALLSNAETADMARYALERIPGPKADDALLRALRTAAPEARVGIINSLGERRCAGAVTFLGALVTDADPVVAEASLAALGKIANPVASVVLLGAKGEAPQALQPALADALLCCADQLMAEGKTDDAAGIYEILYRPSEPKQVRVGAFQGLVAVSGDRGVDLVVAALTGDDVQLQGVATSVVREMPGVRATETFAGQLPQMTPDGQVRMLVALADRGDREALPAVERAVNSDNQDVRLAALDAMGRLGDASSVMALAKAAAGAEGPEADGARKSLYTLQGAGVDAVVLDNLGAGDVPVRIELMRAAVERNLVDAVPRLLGALDDAHEAVRAGAFKGLAALAEEEHVPALVDRLVNAATDTDRAEAEKAVVAVAHRIPDEANRGAAVLEKLPAVSDVKARCSLLKVLGDLGDSRGLADLRAATNDADPGVQDVAVRALSQWPNTAVLDDLLAIAGNTPNQTHRVLALRGYVRLLGLPSDRSIDETLGKYGQALSLASRAEEKKAVLAGLAVVKDPGALKLIDPYLSDPELQAEAVVASLKIGQAICGAYSDDVKAVVEKILAAAEDEGARSQAQEVLRTIDRFAGYIRAWQVSGPYSQEGKSGSDLFDIAFPPEDPGAQGVVWQVMPTDTNPDRPWLMNLLAVLGGNDRVAYLRTKIVSPVEQEAQVELGSDDGVKVWLNGEMVHANNASRGLAPGEDKFNVKLNQGENALMLKVTNGSGEWEACVRLRTPGGAELEGIRTRIK